MNLPNKLTLMRVLLIPVFLAMVSLRLMGAYRVNLWKWFLGLSVTMVWSWVTLAKFLTPFVGDQVYNPGGDPGLFCGQRIEQNKANA